MRKILLPMIVVACFYCSVPALAATPSDTVASVESAWAAAFVKLDVDALASLYTEDATQFGSTAKLAIGRNEIRQYFDGLTKDAKWGVKFGEQHMTALSKTVIATSGFALFTKESAGNVTELPYRITFVLVRVGREWRIAVHHFSPKPKAS